MPESVEFQSGGETVRGDLYLPGGEGPHPIVVMAGGWCYVKELVQPRYAELFAQAGVAALVFDYRHLGASDGEPRQHIDPDEQIEDYRNAISYVTRQDELDADRLGVWGISYSGGHSLVIAATDRRVKAVCSIVPVIDGWENMRRVHGMEGFRALRKAVEEDREKRYDGAAPGYIPMSTLNVGQELCTWPFPETYAAFKTLKETVAPRHEHRNTIASTEMLMNYSVFPFVPRILNVSTLMIIADEDDLTLWDKEIEAFKAIGSQDKELFVTPTVSHMELYSDKTSLELAAEKAAGFFERKLLAGQPVAA
jgi:fermentation-respiration switch protein FrsA (DUF1100 family)